MSNRSFVALMASMSLVAMVAGCTPAARDDVGKAGADLSSATVKSAVGTEQAVDNAGHNVAVGTEKAVQGTEKAVVKSGEAVATGTKEAVQGTEKAVANTGHDIKVGTEKAVQGTEKAVILTGAAVATGGKEVVQGTEKAVAKAGAAATDSSAVLTLTPKVKAAILRDDSVKMLDLNIDTKADTKEVVVNGTASSAQMKAHAMADAKASLADAHSNYKLVDNIKVGTAK